MNLWRTGASQAASGVVQRQTRRRFISDHIRGVDVVISRGNPIAGRHNDLAGLHHLARFGCWQPSVRRYKDMALASGNAGIDTPSAMIVRPGPFPRQVDRHANALPIVALNRKPVGTALCVRHCDLV